ncbi:MAG: alpha/beta hydrolase [Rhodobacteraceae bacterium]|nr:alpha/beta hydrolase [Paracoccaceae bacterium]
MRSPNTWRGVCIGCKAAISEVMWQTYCAGQGGAIFMVKRNGMDIEKIAGRNVGMRYGGMGDSALLIHCALAHSGAFSPLMACLSAQLSMTAFDLPGHGQTQFDPASDIQDQALEIAVALLERQTRASHLVGHSFGATVALRLAVEHPDLVASVCLYEPVYFSMLHGVNRAAYDQETQDSQGFTRAAMRKDWPEAAREFLQRWSVEGFDQLPAAQQGYILKTIPLIIASNQSVVLPEKGGQLFERLAKIKVPVGLMAGESSPVVVHDILDAIGSQIPQAKRFVVAGAGHMGVITHPLDVAEIIREITKTNP